MLLQVKYALDMMISSSSPYSSFFPLFLVNHNLHNSHDTSFITAAAHMSKYGFYISADAKYSIDARNTHKKVSNLVSEINKTKLKQKQKPHLSTRLGFCFFPNYDTSST